MKLKNHALKNCLALCVVCSLLVGCQQGKDVADADTPWTVYESPNKSLAFQFPDAMSRTDRSSSPTAFMYHDHAGDFAISVLHGTDGATSDFAASMIAVSLEGCTKIGSTNEISIGTAEGLEQQYQMVDEFGQRMGTTIVVTTEDERLVFDISFPASREEQLKPIADRVIKSLKFGAPAAISLASGA